MRGHLLGGWGRVESGRVTTGREVRWTTVLPPGDGDGASDRFEPSTSWGQRAVGGQRVRIVGGSTGIAPPGTPRYPPPPTHPPYGGVLIREAVMLRAIL